MMHKTPIIHFYEFILHRPLAGLFLDFSLAHILLNLIVEVYPGLRVFCHCRFSRSRQSNSPLSL